MRFRRCVPFVAGVVLTALPGSATLLDITDLFNTGVDNAHVPIAEDQPDPHYFYAVPPPTGTVPLAATGANGFPVSPGGPWMGDNGLSTWLVPAPDTTGNVGDYTYRTTFTVPAGVDPSQVFVRGKWTSDNAGVGILINGSATGITGPGDFTVFTGQWAIGRGFSNGLNAIDFVVNEATGSAGAGGFTGLRVEMAGKYTSAGRVPISSLKNSGTAAAESDSLPDNTLDPNVTISGAVAGPAIIATSTGGFPIPPWAGDSRDSAWLVPAADTNGPEGALDYLTSFDLTGLDPSTVEIHGRWAVDNVGLDILLNGVPTGNINNGGFADWTDFTLSPASGETFLPGANTLTFQTTNGPGAGPTGVRFEFLSATALIPEPATAAFAAIGTLVFLRRRRSARRA